MGKKVKSSEKEIGLLTIGKQNNPITAKVVDYTQKSKEEISVFSEIKAKAQTVIEKTIRVNQPVSGIEENNIVAPDLSKETLPIIPPVPLTIVYELTYMEGGIETIVYTRDEPSFLEKHLLSIVNGFGRSDLREVVLGKKEIKTSCNKTLPQSQILIDMRGGLLFKVVPEQEWMNRGYDETKKLFDETVLKAYREAATTPSTVVNQKQEDKRRPIQQEDEGHFSVGNIPVNRGAIMNDF